MNDRQRNVSAYPKLTTVNDGVTLRKSTVARLALCLSVAINVTLIAQMLINVSNIKLHQVLKAGKDWGSYTPSSMTTSSTSASIMRRMQDFDLSIDDVMLSTTSNRHTNVPSCIDSESLHREPRITWPQVDHRMVQVMRNGIHICPSINIVRQETVMTGKGSVTKEYYVHNKTEMELPPNGLATVVTCMFYVKAKHGRHEYKNWIPLMLEATDPMVIFVDSEPLRYDNNFSWVEFFRVREMHKVGTSTGS